VKLVTFDRTAGLTPGLLLSDGIIDIPGAASLLAGSGHVPEGTSKEMFALVLDIIESGLTLDAGDVIATGTPSGVGYAMEEPQFLKPGDVVECKLRV
jgi:hypothetical protein